MDKKILVPLAEGFEMLEALSIVDVFRRAGAHVDLAAVGEDLQVTSSHHVTVTADLFLAQCCNEIYDLIVLPGGIPGAQNLQKSELLVELLKNQESANRLYGAICAAPALVLEHHGLLAGKNATCHPGFVEKLSSQAYADERVVVDKNCVTSRGAGTSIEFSLALLGMVMGSEKKQAVAKGMAI
ncbi:MAG: DJ-1/PfpI family protein [Desulforhopalus sp.]|nr:DJ-1/PfpI family protein [Desulforhopalus sp.]